jgi:hypothetical protein
MSHPWLKTFDFK